MLSNRSQEKSNACKAAPLPTPGGMLYRMSRLSAADAHPPGILWQAWLCDRLQRASRWLARVYTFQAGAPANALWHATLRWHAALLAAGLFAANLLMSVCLIALDCHRDEHWLLVCRFPGRLAPDLLNDGQMHLLLGGLAAAWLPALGLEMAGCAWICRQLRPGNELRSLRRQVQALLIMDVLIVWAAAHLN